MYGRDPPGKIHLDPLERYEPSAYERYLREKLAAIREFVEGHIVKSQQRQKEHYGKGSKVFEPSKFTVGPKCCFRFHEWA